MIQDVKYSLLASYAKFLKNNMVWKQLEEVIEITTPYLDRHNDYIQLYLKQDGNKDNYILTDDSYTIEDLEQSGCKLDSDKQQEFLAITLNGFGVHRIDNEIFVKTNHLNFALDIHNFIQAILAVNNMRY